jgi:hypothetical protein
LLNPELDADKLRGLNGLLQGEFDVISSRSPNPYAIPHPADIMTCMIRRRLPETIALSVGCLALLAWARHLPFWGAAIAVLFAFGCAALAVLGPASGECPVCKKMLHGLFTIATGAFERCPHCRAYFSRAEKREVPTDLIADHPSFSVPIDQGETLPNLCCVCGRPAERVEQVVHSAEGRLSHVSPQVIKQEFKISVPYCKEHNESISIWNEDLAPSVPLITGGQQVTDHRWVMKVRSYGFYRAAVGPLT